MFYYNVPVHLDCEDGSTDYIWEKNKRYIQMNEGIGYGRTNNEGYMETDDYHGEKADVLIMGSSHLQGLSIPQERNMSSLLQDLLKENVYSLAMAGHNLKVCVSNLNEALEKYRPDVVVLETNNIAFTHREIKTVLNDEVPQTAAENEGIIGLLQRSPFLRLAYSQYQNFITEERESRTDKDYADESRINELLQLIRQICETHDCKTVILYHPTLSLNDDGSLQVNTDERTGIWSRLCKENGITYLDMSEKYIEEYEKNRILPYGFINTKIGNGHLNVEGHRMMAEELYRILKEEH
ncbi:MAG: hypothetical protein J5365_01135 [Erysipelotrichaceae bacterium]|nr:hypothetical protein [Erysipelotrichaceae bacterium]